MEKNDEKRSPFCETQASVETQKKKKNQNPKFYDSIDVCKRNGELTTRLLLYYTCLLRIVQCDCSILALARVVLTDRRVPWDCRLALKRQTDTVNGTSIS